MISTQLSKQDAKTLLAKHHLKQLSIREVFEKFRSIQFDPLNPAGRNHDLVLQARVAGYQVDDWQKLAYQDRFIYDFWDKQASLVLMQDWPRRRIFHKWHAKRWYEQVLKPHKKTVPIVLQELKDRGPLSSTDFEHQPHVKKWEGSWYGPKLTKNILRALWHTGEVVTHSRRKGHHVYDLAENVISAEFFRAKPLPDKLSLEFLMMSRHQAVGLLSPRASSEVWSLHISAAERKDIIEVLIKQGELIACDVEGQLFHATPDALQLLSDQTIEEKMTFIAPLD